MSYKEPHLNRHYVMFFFLFHFKNSFSFIYEKLQIQQDIVLRTCKICSKYTTFTELNEKKNVN